MTANEKLALLRGKMKENGIQAYYIPSSDPHMSEYLPDHWRIRAWLSGFSGSAGVMVVTETESALWTDGRYFIQAARQIQGSEIVLQRMNVPGVPTVAEYLSSRLGKGDTLGLDGMITPAAFVRELETAFAGKDVSIRSLDLISPIWSDRPCRPATQAFVHPVEYTGLSAAEKISALRQKLTQAGADSILLARLDSIVWLLNVRASDISYTPALLSFCLVTPDSAVLYTDAGRLPQEVRDHLAGNGVSVASYDAIPGDVDVLDRPVTMLCSGEDLPWSLLAAIEKNPHITVREGRDPVQAMKACKNDTEISCLRNAHIKEGVAMVRMEMELERRLAAGERLTECDVHDILNRFRQPLPLFLGESFSCICAYGPNAAMMHYSPTPDHCAVVEPRGLLLLDTGSQFLDGTTDTTRTYQVGPLTDEERRFYTYVLKAHISLARGVFMKGCSGANLDVLSRVQVWQYGIDYRCGTGHGVGYLGGVHEGPHSMRLTNSVPLEPGMIVTDEPGIYEEGRVGIRIENELVVVPAMETEYGQFYRFEAVTRCPIDTRPVIRELLTYEEVEWLDRFHETVCQDLKDYLEPEEQAWLREKTRPLA